MGWNWDHMDRMGPWDTVWGWLFLALLVVVLVVLVILLVRLMSERDLRHEPRPSGRSRAREVLDERYARGEIDSTEYDERRRRLDDGEAD